MSGSLLLRAHHHALDAPRTGRALRKELLRYALRAANASSSSFFTTLHVISYSCVSLVAAQSKNELTNNLM